jgi:hypothetical protein
MEADDLEDFWQDLHPPKEPEPEGVPEKGYLWMVPILHESCPAVLPRRKVPIPPFGEELKFEIPIIGKSDQPLVVIGVELYAHPTSHELIHRMTCPPTFVGPSEVKLQAVIKDDVDTPYAGFRTNLRLRGLL